jgi:hypothetical protein
LKLECAAKNNNSTGANSYDTLAGQWSTNATEVNAQWITEIAGTPYAPGNSGTVIGVGSYCGQGCYVH